MFQVLTGVKDEAAKEVLEMIPSNTLDVAIRRFAQQVQENKFINKNAKDFNLYWLGEWNTETGKITPREPEIIATAKEFTIEEKKEDKK